MAKRGNKLTKLKSILKKMQSFKINHINDDGNPLVVGANPDVDFSTNNNNYKDMHEVYVGKSRRRYLVSKTVVNHPLFRELVVRTGDSKEESSVVSVGCEVVLFEHMIWMLKHVGIDFQQESSLGELVEFYAYY